MSYTSIIIGFVLTFLLTVITTPLIIYIAKKLGYVDRPNDRKKHNGDIPLLGGLAIIIPIIGGLLYFQPEHYSLLAISIGAVLIIVSGIADDIFNLKPVTKLLVQVTASVIVLSSGIMIEKVTVPFLGSVDIGLFGYVLTVLWIVGITNAMNLIDGLDGLATGIAGIAFVSVFVMAVGDGAILVVTLSTVFIAALSAFLIFNFYPAKIFLGDTGSLFIGYSLAVISMLGLFKNVTVFTFIVPIVLLTIPIFDTLFAIVRRAMNKQHIMAADRKHIHYVLLEMGLGHRKTVLLIYLFSAFFGLTAIVFTNATTILSLFIMMGVLIVLHILAELTGVVYNGKQPVVNSIKRLFQYK